MAFKRGDKVFWKRPDDGEEIAVTFESYITDGNNQKLDCQIRLRSGLPKEVKVESVLPLKEQGFAIRDYAWVIDSDRNARRGEIVALGHTKGKRQFYLLRFENDESVSSHDWYTEDEVFNIEEPKDTSKSSYGLLEWSKQRETVRP